MFSSSPLFIFPDPVCGGPGVRHRPGEDVQILLPEAQDEGHQLLPRGRVRSADRMAYHRRGARVLRLFPSVQVKIFMAAWFDNLGIVTPLDERGIDAFSLTAARLYINRKEYDVSFCDEIPRTVVFAAVV